MSLSDYDWRMSPSQLVQGRLLPAPLVHQKVTWAYPIKMTREDLGIVDQNLDDKVGMEA
jgi:hypothetical protein